ncbi:glycosyltransferase family protein [Balneolales bacterium ANBcel1]|nr:glycosyltransferase family protein [Balneolales bacterium ANBcel1]
MKILYAIQGTGNGHISRARTFIPRLKQIADVDVLVSGSSSEVSPGVPVTYRVSGLGYRFGTDGGIDYAGSIRDFHPVTLVQDVHHLPVNDYHFVISDFEPVSAYACRIAGKMCFGLSHQASFLSQNSPRPPRKSLLGEAIFRHYAPCTHPVGFHFREYDQFIYPPVIRDEVRKLETPPCFEKQPVLIAGNGSASRPNPIGRRSHITVYLPAYDDLLLLKQFEQITDVDWHIFSKASTRSYEKGHMHVRPVSQKEYLESLKHCAGVICGTGFEAPSEALFLGKPLLTIPMRGQYEQWCNAAALELEGISVCRSIDRSFPDKLRNWLSHPNPKKIPFPDRTDDVIAHILAEYEKSRTRVATPSSSSHWQKHAELQSNPH